MKVHRLWLLAGLAVGVATAAGPAAAQDKKLDFPTRPIELVVPYGAGGGNDLTARAVASVAAEYLGQPLVIRIRPGAGSVLGLAEVARARPDGYTLGLPGPHAVTSAAFQDIPINVVEDFEPIAGLTDWPFILLVPGDSKFNSFEEFLKHAKENPGGITVGNGGSLTIAHLPALMLELEAGVEFTHVPFDGGGPLFQGISTGSVDTGFGIPAWAVPAVKDGRLKALAVAGDKRMEQLPDVPTLKEFGYDINLSLAIGIVAPKGVPQERLEFLRKAFAEVAKDKSYTTLIKRLGDQVVYRDAESFWQVFRDVDRQSKAVAKKLKEAGVVK